MSVDFFSTDGAGERYTRLKLLGRGANGWVYLVRSQTDKKIYVFKKIYFNDREQKKFIRGHEYSKKVSNDAANDGFFPRVLDIGSFESTDKGEFTGIVMEYFEGETFDDFLKRNTDVNTRIAKMAEVFEAIVGKILPIARNNGVLLGDMKPDNFLLRASGAISFFDFDGVSSSIERDPDIGIDSYLRPPELGYYYQFHATSDLYILAKSIRWEIEQYKLNESTENLSAINRGRLKMLNAFGVAAKKDRIKDRVKELRLWNKEYELLANQNDFDEIYKPKRMMILRVLGRYIRDLRDICGALASGY